MTKQEFQSMMKVWSEDAKDPNGDLAGLKAEFASMKDEIAPHDAELVTHVHEIVTAMDRLATYVTSRQEN